MTRIGVRIVLQCLEWIIYCAIIYAISYFLNIDANTILMWAMFGIILDIRSEIVDRRNNEN